MNIFQTEVSWLILEACGVPQGSILGPLLFLLYVNDMQAAVSCKLLLYADDSALIVSDKELKNVENKLSVEMSCVSWWLVDNKLSLHLGKTESILFGPKKKIKNNKLKVKCNDIDIKSKDCITYLGAEIDCHMSGSQMCSNILKKCNARVKYLYRKSKFLTPHSRRLLASALVQCHLDYACSFWYSGLTKQFKTHLQNVQNRLIRFILKLPARTHISADHFISVDWLP